MVIVSKNCVNRTIFIFLLSSVSSALASNDCLVKISNTSWSILIQRVSAFSIKHENGAFWVEPFTSSYLGYFSCNGICKYNFSSFIQNSLLSSIRGLLQNEKLKQELTEVLKKHKSSAITIFIEPTANMDTFETMLSKATFKEGFYLNETKNTGFVWNTKALDLELFYEEPGGEYVLKQNTSIHFANFSVNGSSIFFSLLEEQQSVWTTDSDFLYLSQMPSKYVKSVYSLSNTSIIGKKNVCEESSTEPLMLQGGYLIFEIIGGTLLVIVVIAVSLAVCRWYVKKRRKSTHEQQHLNWILNNPMIKYVHHTENGDTEGESNDDKVYVEPIEFHNIAFPEQNIPTQNAVTSGDPQRISVQTVADEEFLYDYAYGALSKKPTKSPTLPKRPTKSPKSRKKSEPQKKMSIPMEDKYYM
ncbi:uncharacterized protein LOC114327836 [Diabrotica virgifera virgifera]|uniref:Uncharacterized protein LOC114327836 isoform X1 n=1 Tax=Diabrotica virgifera virgifera TaxID=50390 RepID=A0A6P7FGN3_DIAVI|nr:uncharacterized protein LOC114327836 [Diabrotica virgifera virgifera]